MNLYGKTAIVTGAANGIGKAIAEKLVAQGANIAMVDIDEEKSRHTASHFANNKLKVKVYIKDLRQVEEINSLYESIVNDFGTFDIIVNAAGIIEVSRFLEVTSEDWNSIMDLNAKSLFFSMQEAAKYLIRFENGGRIINISSITGKSSRPDYPVYAASKAAINSITKSAATALAKYNITVNAVCPGYIHTDMWERMDEFYVKNYKRKPGEIIENMLRTIPLQRSGQQEEIASMVLYLSSLEAAYITGQSINVDGGAVMH